MIAELSQRHRVGLVTTHAPGDDPSVSRRGCPPASGSISVPYALPKQGTRPLRPGAWPDPGLSPLPGGPLAMADPGRRGLGSAERLDGGCRPLRGGLPGRDAERADSRGRARRPLRAQRRVHDLETASRGREATVAAGAARGRVAQDATLRGAGVRPGRRSPSPSPRPTAPSWPPTPRAPTSGPSRPAWTPPTSTRTARSRPRPRSSSRAPWTGTRTRTPSCTSSTRSSRRSGGEVPGVSLTVVGRDPTDRLRAAGAAAGVRVTGTVADVRPHVAEAAVYVVPLRVGGGTRLKIFEALAMGKAVVVHPGRRRGAAHRVRAALPPGRQPGGLRPGRRHPAQGSRPPSGPGHRRTPAGGGALLLDAGHAGSSKRHCEELVTRHAR